MATALPTFLTQVDYILSADDNELAYDARTELTEAAIQRYSHDKPDVITVDVSGDGGNYYAISSLTSWSDDFSQILRIEYPAATVASDEAPVYLEPDDYDFDYWDGSTRYIYLPNHAPAATEAMRIRYTAPYTATNNAYDTPPADFHAICQLAAGLCAQAIANKYSRSNDSTIAADSVNHLERSERWAARARELIKMYEAHVGVDAESDRERPAGEFVDWDTRPDEVGRWLYH